MVENFLRTLVCPLDWGIGHATRCVPVIRHLLDQKHEVIIAADGRPLDFLKEYFPELEFVRLPGFRVSYPPGNKMMLKMFLQSPFIFINIFKEYSRLKKIIRKFDIDVVISDNRFGLWSKNVYSVYMTHQVMIKAPDNMKWSEPILHRFHGWFIRHYDECWIPDLPGDMNLSGDLGHKYPLPINGHFTGILSRFEESADPPEPNDPDAAPDLLIMLSGPEPQRSVLEKLILKELDIHRGLHAVILQGLPGKIIKHSPLPGVIIFNHLPDRDISRLIRQSGTIICRPGYSTIMDLVTIGRSAILIPTPGQTEQEYLAGYLSANGSFGRMDQAGFDLGLALQAGRQLHETLIIRNDRSLLAARIKALHKKNLVAG